MIAPVGAGAADVRLVYERVFARIAAADAVQPDSGNDTVLGLHDLYD